MHTFKKIMLGMMGTAVAAGMLAFMPLTSMAAGDIAINETNFPDPVLRQFLLNQNYGTDGKITQTELPDVKQIYLWENDLTDAKGIELLPYLEMFKSPDSKLTSIDLSKNTKLKILNIEGNSLSSLDVSNCKELTDLRCSGNKFSTLDVSGLKSLETLVMGGDSLTELKAVGCTSLKDLNAEDGKLQKVDISGCSSMTWFICGNNEITSLNVSNCKALERLGCAENKLKSLDVSGCTALAELSCSDNQLTSIDMSGCTALTSIDVSSNKFSKLDLSKFTNLENVTCSGNPLKNGSLILSSSVKSLTCEDNLFTQINFAEAKSLEELICNNNKLSSINISNNSNLKILRCSKTGLKSIDLSKNKKLEYLICDNNNLTTLNLDNNKNIYFLDCSFNQLKSLSFPAGSELYKLTCTDNKLTGLDLVNAEDLVELNCEHNDLKDIDVSQCPGIVRVVKEGAKSLSEDKTFAEYDLNTTTTDDDGAIVDEGETYHFSVDVKTKINLDSLKLDKNTAQIVCGKTLTLKATPKNKSAKVTWTTSDKSIATVDKSGKITAKMAGKVTITATASGSVGKCVVTVLYKDVKNTKDFWFTPTNELTARGIVKGYDKQTKFKPANECTRAQMVTFLYRLSGEPEVKSSTCKFPDVKSTDYFFKPVIWAVENGITTGYGDGKFKPQNVCTRAQTVTFLWRMAEQPSPWKKKCKFSDVKSTDYFYIPVIWASERKIVAGYSDGTFKPQGKCLRRQMVTFLYKYSMYA